MSGGSAYLRVDSRKLQGGSQKTQDLFVGLYVVQQALPEKFHSFERNVPFYPGYRPSGGVSESVWSHLHPHVEFHVYPQGGGLGETHA